MGRFTRVAITLAAMVFGGCAADRSVADPGSANDAPRVRRVVEWIASGRRDAYSCSLLAGARKAASALGVDLLIHDTPGTTWVDQQRLLAQRIEGEQSEWPHAVVLDPVDYRPPLILTVRSTHDRGLPVVLVDEPLQAEFLPGSGAWFNPGFAWSFVSSDENAIGARAATELTQRLSGRPGETLVVTSPASHADRSNGFQSALRANPGFPEPHRLTVDGKSIDEDEATVSGFLRSHPRVVGAFAADAAAAAALARANARRDRPFPIVAGDAEPEELRLLANGALQALVVRPGFQVGEIALRVAAEAVIHREPPQQGTPPPQVLTQQSVEGMAPGAALAGLDSVSDCSS